MKRDCASHGFERGKRYGQLVAGLILFFELFLPFQSRGAEPSVVALSLVFHPLPVMHHNIFPYRQLERPKIGLALSGGGARGLAQIGVLKAFEEENIPVDLIAGTSIGSIIGGLYALDYSPETMREILSTIDWGNIFSNSPQRRDLFLSQKQDSDRHIIQFRLDGLKPYIPQALSAGQRLSAILNELHLQSRYSSVRDFNNLKVPYRAVATDFVKGEKVILASGDLSQVMLASMAVPLLFTPIMMEGRMLVDGGLVDNLPTDITRSMGADLVIGVNTVSPMRNGNELRLPWEHADQMTNIMQKPINEELVKHADIVIQPKQEGRLLTDFSNPDSAIGEGYRAAMELIPSIRKQLRQYPLRNESNFYFIPEAIVFRGLINVPSDSPASRLTLREGVRTDVKSVQEDLYRFYDTGFFRDVRATIIREENKYTVTFIFEENPVVSRVEFEGNSVFPDSILFAGIRSGGNTVFNYHAGEEDYHRLTEMYRSRNYTLAEIDEVSFDEITRVLTIHISEGIIGAVETEGNIRTRDHVILREFPLKVGEIFNFEKAKQGIANIYSTGLFERVYLSIISANPHPRIAIKLIEKKPRSVKIGGRYGLERGTKGFVEIENDNTFGIGAKSSTLLKYGDRDELAQYELRTDRIFKSYLTTRLDVHFSRTRNVIQDQPKQVGEFEDRRYGGAFSLGQQIERLGTVTAEARIEDVRISADPARYSERYNLSTITFRSIVDTQDKYPFPRQGSYIHMYYEIASRLFGGEAAYNKIYTSFDWFLPVSKYHVIHPHAAFGTADETLPFGERFHLGGDQSLYGYRDGGLHGRAVLDGSLEYRVQVLFDRFLNGYFSVRYDLGGIWNKLQNMQFRTMHHGYGASFALELPSAGPFEIGYGHSGQHNRIYLSLGHRF